METVLIVNPAAGAWRCGRAWPRIRRQLSQAGITFDVLVSEKPGDGTRLAAEALQNGAQTVVAVGGDGTVNEVANGFFDSTLPSDRPIASGARLGYIPLGTGRDFAQALRMFGDPSSIALGILGPRSRTMTIDVGRATFVGPVGRPVERYFLVGADLGLGGETTAALETGAPWLKRGGGLFAYFVAALKAIAAHRATDVTVAVDGGAPRRVRSDIVFVANGPFTGGGMRMAPTAALDDGLFDLLILRDSGKLTLLFQLLPTVYRGTHLGHPAVEHSHAHRVEVDTSARLLLQLDGEQPGRAPATFTVVPNVLPVAVPG